MELSSAVIEANGDFVSIIPTATFILNIYIYIKHIYIYIEGAPLINGGSRMKSLNNLFETCSFMSAMLSEAPKAVIDKWSQLRLCTLTSNTSE